MRNWRQLNPHVVPGHYSGRLNNHRRLHRPCTVEQLIERQLLEGGVKESYNNINYYLYYDYYCDGDKDRFLSRGTTSKLNTNLVENLCGDINVMSSVLHSACRAVLLIATSGERGHRPRC